MAASDMKAYLSAMTQIKLRIDLANKVISRKIDMRYDVPVVEFCALQIRMITETIVLASLAANRVLFEENQEKFCQHWHPRKIMIDIEKLNPDYYPIPIIELPAGDDRPTPEFLTRTEGFLTKDELVKVHGKCGNVLHARNQFHKDLDTKHYLQWIRECIRKIMNLLSSHTITLLEDDKFYLVQMHAGSEGSIMHYQFVRKDD